MNEQEIKEALVPLAKEILMSVRELIDLEKQKSQIICTMGNKVLDVYEKVLDLV